MAHKGKSYLEQRNKVEPGRSYPVREALDLVVSTGRAKFDETVDVAIRLGVNPKHADQMVRGAVSLPNGIGKARRVIAFCDDADAALAAGAIEAGVDELIKKVTDGWMDFDVAIASPKVMGKVGKLGRVLGPQGKMPSPKNGTVTADVVQAVKDFAAGKVEFRNDAGGNVHAVVGKLSFEEPKLLENIDAFVNHIKKIKPSAMKGTYIKKVCLSATMSPGVQVDIV